MTNEDYLLRFHRFQKSREKYFAPKINIALHRQYIQFTDHVRQYRELAVNYITSTTLISVIRNLYMDAGIVYGAKVRAGLKKQETKARMPMGFSERMAELIAEYFRGDILNQSEGITQTTRDLIREKFTEAYSQGLGIDDIIKYFENTELSKIRARLIARTETVTSANRAAHFVAIDSGLEVNKIWLSARDSRVRHDHREINGRTIGRDDYFVVGGYEMLCPGDRGGHDGKPLVPAKEICNCRCTTLYKTI